MLSSCSPRSRAARGVGGHPHRRHPLDHRAGGVSRHPGRAGGSSCRRADRRREGPASRSSTTAATRAPARRTAKADHRRQGRSDRRPVGDADLARGGGGRRRTRGVPVISLAGGGAIVGAAGRAAPVGFQDVADRDDIDRPRARSPGAEARAKTVATIGLATGYGEGFPKAIEGSPRPRGVKIVAVEKYSADRPERDRAGAQGHRRQSGRGLHLRPPARRARCRRSARASAATRAWSTRRRASATTISCASAARASRAASDGRAGAGGRAAARRNPIKKAGVDFVKRYEEAHGPGSRSLFAATAWDACCWLQQASRDAMKKAQAGHARIPPALRDAIEGLKDLVGRKASTT